MRTKPALMSMFEMEVAAFNNNFRKKMSISIFDGKFKISQSFFRVKKQQCTNSYRGILRA